MEFQLTQEIFLWSSLPPKFFLLNIDSIEEIIPEGALKKERAYTGREDRTDFMRIKRPPNDKNLLFHIDILFAIRATTGSQKDNLLASPPTGSPRYIKGILPTLQFRTVAAAPNQESLMLIPDSMLLLKFTFKPNTLSNNTKTARKARTFTQLFLPNNNVSSANCKWKTDNPLSAPKQYPVYSINLLVTS